MFVFETGINYIICMIEFITTLDRDFPSTVSTISRTASKLTPLNEMDLSKKCAICDM